MSLVHSVSVVDIARDTRDTEIVRFEEIEILKMDGGVMVNRAISLYRVKRRAKNSSENASLYDIFGSCKFMVAI